MELAYRMASRAIGTTSTNPPVGCVIVKKNVILARGWTQPGGAPHAEVHAINSIKDKSILKRAEIYCTLEPCSHFGKTNPCVDSIINSKIRKVYIGSIDKNPKVNGNGIEILRAAKIKVELLPNNLITSLNNIFFNSKINYKPYLIAKIATTADSKITRINSKSRWITTKLSRLHGHYLRYRSDAMLVGKNTVLMDDPDMHCRLNGLDRFSPDIFILDSNLNLPIERKIFHSKKRNIYIFHKKKLNQKKIDKFKKSKVILIPVKQKNNLLDINEVLLEMGRLGIQRILVEGGAQLISQLTKKGLVDIFYWFSAGKSIGKKTKNVISDLRVSKTSSVKDLRLVSVMNIQSDTLEVYNKK